MSETVEKQAGNLVTSENLSQWMSDKLGLDTKVTDVQPKNEEKVTQEPAKVTQKAESNEDQEAQDAANESKGDDEHKAKVKNSYIKLREQRNQARDEIARLKSQLEEAQKNKTEQKVEQTKPTGLIKPDPSQFTDAFEYAEALAEYKVNEKLESQRLEQAQKEAKERAETVSKNWKSRVNETVQEFPDYDEVLEGSAHLTVSDQVRDAILESEVGPKILYHLAKNPELVSNIAQMTVTGALRAIGRLETKFEKQADTKTEVKETKEVSKAPEPIKPLKGSNAPQLPVDDKGEFTGSIAEYKRLRREGKLR